MASLQHDLDAARRDPGLAVLEGVHALKHAARFGAVVELVATPDTDELATLLARLAPDVRLPVEAVEVDRRTWDHATRGGLPSPCIAVARRPADHLDEVLATRDGRPVVALERPTHLGNVGAVVRVAAAADVAGVVVTGSADPWHPRAIRGGAGLQFALPVGRRASLPASTRPVVAVDPDGDLAADVPPDDMAGAILVFGTERHGLSDDLLGRADHRLRLPMRAGVSSLNLATSVAAVLYGPGMVV